MKRNRMFYMKLFWFTFQLSAFTFGGGYVIVPMMKKQFVEKLGWLEEEEMLNFTAIAQSSPGAIAINASVLLGYRLAGIPGALLTVIATVLPPLIFLSVIAVGYKAFIGNEIVRNVLSGMQAGVCAVIIDVVIGMSRATVRARKAVPILLMTGAFIAAAVFHVNVIFIILAGALVGFFSAVKNPGGEGGV